MGDQVTKAKDIISKIIYITIASVSKNGQPWNSPVYSAYDREYNFYWSSSRDSQHSKNIYDNPNIFLVIYDSTIAEGQGIGVYVKAKAFELTYESELQKALELLYGRKNKPPKPAADFLYDSPRRVFKAEPEQFWINTDDKVDGHHIDKRVEIKLN